MTELFVIFAILWIVGWTHQLAVMAVGFDKMDKSKKPTGLMIIIIVMLMGFTWPFWYFYGKHI